MYEDLHSVSVAAAIVDDAGRVFVIKRRDNGEWTPPGGILKREESVLEGLKREVLEETGFSIQPASLTGVYKNMKIGVIALFFRATLLEGKFAPNEEATEGRWMTLDEIVDSMNEAFSIRLVDAVRGPSPAIRSHDGKSLIPEL